MNIVRILFFSLSIFFLNACQSQKIALKFHTAQVAPQRFDLESQMKLIVGSGDSAEALGSNLRVWLHSSPIVTYDDGSGRFQMQADSANYRSGQRSVEECLHIERLLAQQGFQFKMGANGEMQDLRMDGFVPDLERTDIDLRRLILKIQPVLPGGLVGPGDTWERQQFVGDSANDRAYVYKWFQVEDVFDRKGKTIAKLRMNIKYRLDSTDMQVQAQSADFVLGSGVILFNVTDGQLDDVTLEIDGSLNVLESSPQNNQPSIRVRQLLHLWRESP